MQVCPRVTFSKKLSNPSSAERKQLAKLFPSSRAGSNRYESVFDPMAECVARPAQQKKKKTSNVLGRTTSREVVLMKSYTNKEVSL